jgi:anti-anti-sigma factor
VAGISLKSAAMANDTLQIASSEGNRAGQKILKLTGSLTIHSVFAFQEATREETAQQVILDFSGVPYMDSAGLGALEYAGEDTHRHDSGRHAHQVL